MLKSRRLLPIPRSRQSSVREIHWDVGIFVHQANGGSKRLGAECITRVGRAGIERKEARLAGPFCTSVRK
jgi:hypothetical protein